MRFFFGRALATLYEALLVRWALTITSRKKWKVETHIKDAKVVIVRVCGDVSFCCVCASVFSCSTVCLSLPNRPRLLPFVDL